MSFTNQFMDMRQVACGAGVRTPFGMLLAPGARVAAFVRSTGVQDGDPTDIVDNLVTTLNAGLARCRAGMGDIVVCLPGHSESVATATVLSNLVAGTRIIGVGRGGNMPVFRWTATGAQWALNKADVVIAGLRLRLEGANGVVKAINITAADVLITGCDIEVASGAAAKATIAIEVGAAGHRAEISDNRWRGTATHNVTDGILVAGAASNVRIQRNEMVASATAANGLIRTSAAALGLVVTDNVIVNTMTASEVGIAFGAQASSGVVARNLLSVLNAGTASAQGISFGAGCLVNAFENYCSDEAVKSGLLSPVAAT